MTTQNIVNVSGGKDSTTTLLVAIALEAKNLQNLNLPPIRDICGQARSTGRHARCSKARHATAQHKWEGA